MARYLKRGIQVDELRLGVESLRRTGPGGSFMTDDLTVQLLRKGEFFANDLLDYAAETAVEGPSLLARAHAKVEQMVANPQSPHSEAVQENLHRYFAGRYRQLEARAARECVPDGSSR